MGTDPTAMAHEVLDLTHEDETVTVCSIPDNKAATLRQIPQVQQLMGEAWKRGYQDRQNDYGAADVTPCPYRTETPDE